MINLQEESDFENTVGISARRFEESPFIECHDTSRMIRGVYAGQHRHLGSFEKYHDTQ